MKIIELFESDFDESIKSILLDYLVSLTSKGTKQISLQQVLVFLKNYKKIHITPAQIDNLLQDTGFEIENNVIRIKPEQEKIDKSEDEIEGKPDPSDVVGNMAQNRLAKEIE